MASLMGSICRRSFATLYNRAPIASRTSVVSMQKRYLPICSVDTSLKRVDVPADFNDQLTKLLARILNKSEKVISISLRTEVDIVRGGGTPSVTVHIWSVGVFDEARNPGYSKQIFDFLQPALNIEPERIALLFHPITRAEAGHLLYFDTVAKK